MRRTAIVLLGLALAMIVPFPAISEDGMEKYDRRSSYGDIKSRTSPADESSLAGVMYASEKLLSEMPDDSYLIGPVTAYRLMRASGVLLLDVRERTAFEAERIPGAVNIPLRSLSQSLNGLPVDKTATIVVYCGNGDRGAMAMTLLRLWGYTNVFSIVDGMNGWTGAELPVARWGRE